MSRPFFHSPCANSGICLGQVDNYSQYSSAYPYKCQCQNNFGGPSCSTNLNTCHKFGPDLTCLPLSNSQDRLVNTHRFILPVSEDQPFQYVYPFLAIVVTLGVACMAFLLLKIYRKIKLVKSGCDVLSKSNPDSGPNSSRKVKTSPKTSSDPEAHLKPESNLAASISDHSLKNSPSASIINIERTCAGERSSSSATSSTCVSLSQDRPPPPYRARSPQTTDESVQMLVLSPHARKSVRVLRQSEV